MIVDMFLLVLQGVVQVLLAPLEVINIGVDFIAGATTFLSFLQVIFYIIPLSNMLPLFFISISIVLFKMFISLIKTLWQLIPFV